jgi:hypothetical protein
MEVNVMTKVADVVIVGAGSAGCDLAAREARILPSGWCCSRRGPITLMSPRFQKSC